MVRVGWGSRSASALLLTLCLALAACTPSPPPTDRSSTSPRPSAPTTPAPSERPPTPPSTTVPTASPEATGAIWRIDGPLAYAEELAGYTTAESVLPGEEIKIKVDSPGHAFDVEIFRIGAYGIAGAKSVAKLPPQPGVKQPACTIQAESMVDCSAWSVTNTVPTNGWEPGLYLMKLHNDVDRWRYLPVVVRSKDHTGSVVFVSATTTWQAYNTFGGYSLYYGPNQSQKARAHKVSFDRPYASSGADTPLMYEVGLIQLIESLGVPITYTTSQGLEAGDPTLAKARAIVFSGHDEYWSPHMRGVVEEARDAGVNLLFMGANNIYWRIRWEGDGRVVVGYKDADLDPIQGVDTTVKFRQSPKPNPEAKTIGAQYTCRGDYQPMVIADETFWAFAGTGVAKNQVLDTLVGGEVDNVTKQSPANTQVVAHSPYTCANGTKSTGDSTYYTAPSGAGVFDAGTFGWATSLTWGTAAPEESIRFVRQVTSTLVTEAAKGPLGKTHPSKPNVNNYLKG